MPYTQDQPWCQTLFPLLHSHQALPDQAEHPVRVIVHFAVELMSARPRGTHIQLEALIPGEEHNLE